MKFKIPFTFSDIEVLKRRSRFFIKFAPKKEGKLDIYLKNSGENVTKRQYLSICYRGLVFYLFIFLVLFTSILGLFAVNLFYLYGMGLAILFTAFLSFNQFNYPRLFALNKKRDVEKNLIPALQDMMVQINSGVPIFEILLSIANSDYGQISKEFKKIVGEINSGTPQIEAMEKYGKLNTSEYFRRVLWQISNGMRAGSDISTVIKEEIKNLSKEQAIQIQSYGNKLNPLIMFYMIIAVIMPALGVTFLIITASMLNLSESLIKILFAAIFFFVTFTQIMFVGLIKSRRPSLL